MKQVAVQWLQVYKWSSELISVRVQESPRSSLGHDRPCNLAYPTS
jgi:hypothetical protein